MPPWLDSAEEVGAVIVAVFAVLGTIGGAGLAALGVVIAAWRSKVRPLLTSTQAAASTAADQLTPNHGSSVRDALTRLEHQLGRLHADLSLDREQVGRRLERLESFHSAPTALSPVQEDTR